MNTDTMEKDEKIRRNRAKTTQRIVEALEDVIAEYGLEGVGVNRVAEKANVSKVLIYRYFGGMEGLLEYYVKMGKLFPVFTPAVLDQIRPLHESDVARIWYRQVIQTYRYFRTFKAAREILKASVIENDSIASTTTRAQDEEMTRLVSQLSFVKGADTQAVSAVILGAMNYLTIMAQNDHTMISIDLRSEEGWQRIENAVKTIYIALNKMAIGSKDVQLELQSSHLPMAQW
ncbi:MULTISPECIES: TetR/AcrR family transcriptional regulator [unclassified Spirosoma]|uniref:TetR/AcrR family transcriptional regulator n=2 Tax=Spirosoma TaxID=107 RepID=UPI0003679311|nr:MULTISPECIES: TetR/AcrR family transcriptional regulator [unclassified Spirosoma]MBN8823024.1 TetR/AcrR family transcriptional regulator [Spirosoma sp.]OJW73123.1 MAG: TetR family transcriptional regulator [Spirosoma sp. 48-14]